MCSSRIPLIASYQDVRGKFASVGLAAQVGNAELMPGQTRVTLGPACKWRVIVCEQADLPDDLSATSGRFVWPMFPHLLQKLSLPIPEQLHVFHRAYERLEGISAHDELDEGCVRSMFVMLGLSS